MVFCIAEEFVPKYRKWFRSCARENATECFPGHSMAMELVWSYEAKRFPCLWNCSSLKTPTVRVRKVSAWEPRGHIRCLGTEVGLLPGAQTCYFNFGDIGLQFASFLCVPTFSVYEHKYLPLVSPFKPKCTYIIQRPFTLQKHGTYGGTNWYIWKGFARTIFKMTHR